MEVKSESEVSQSCLTLHDPGTGSSNSILPACIIPPTLFPGLSNSHTNVQPFVYSQGIKKYQIPPGPGSLPFPSADPLTACLRLRSEAPRWSYRPGPRLCSGAVSSPPPDPRCDLRLLDLEPCERLASRAAPLWGFRGPSPYQAPPSWPPSGSSLRLLPRGLPQAPPSWPPCCPSSLPGEVEGGLLSPRRASSLCW